MDTQFLIDTAYSILPFVLTGFLAQLIDGGLGMGYGISSNAVMVSMGVPPAVSSASVHLAEICTTGVSGIFHYRQGNFNKQLFIYLAIFGVAGGALGAYVLSTVDASYLRPFIALYLLILGSLILRKAFYAVPENDHTMGIYPIRRIAKWMAHIANKLKRPNVLSRRFVGILGFMGGTLDAMGGGGWGPIVSSTLIFNSDKPRECIGSASAAEFFLTTAISLTFLISLGSQGMVWYAVIGLLLGGVIASPISAYAVKRIPLHYLFFLVGTMIMFISMYMLYKAYGTLDIHIDIFMGDKQLI